MNSIKNTFAMTVLAGVLSTNAVTSARAEDATWTLKPLNGLSFDVGAKRALSYFLSETGQCKLTLIVANQMLGDEVPTDTPVRFDVAIDAGKDARLDTAEGKSLRFNCAAQTQFVKVTEIQQVATHASAAK
jgi:hypothetical protein